tara:strand:+ start:1287 stop:2180 length:894 start_codon:yes stop_codon:yes gene_type:complete
MANTLVNVNIDKLAELSLSYLASNGIRLDAFSLNLAGGVKERGETVKTRLAGSLSTQDMTSSRVAGNATMSAVDVTLNNYEGVVIGFSDLERSYTDSQLDSEFIAPALEALQEKVVTDVLTQATTANGFDTNQTTSAVAAFSADTCANIAATLSTNKVPHGNRSAILSPALVEQLVTDGAIQNAAAFGDSNAVRDGKVNRVHGLDIYEYTGPIPAAENMVGIVAHPQSFAIAAREIAEPEPGTWYGQVRSVVDPISGLPFQIRRYYDESTGQQVVSWTMLYGYAIGQVAAASRIVTA